MYFLRDRGKEYGPFYFGQLKTIWKRGVITEAALVRGPGADWHPIATLIEQLETPTPAAPPSPAPTPEPVVKSAKQLQAARVVNSLLLAVLFYVIGIFVTPAEWPSAIAIAMTAFFLLRALYLSLRITPLVVAFFVWAAVSTIAEGILATEGTWNVHPEYQHALWGRNATEFIPVLSKLIASFAAAIAWLTCYARQPRLRFEIPFWGGLLLLAAACRCALRAYLVNRSGVAGTAFDHIGVMPSAPIVCILATGTGIIFILWAIYDEWRSSLRRGNL